MFHGTRWFYNFSVYISIHHLVSLSVQLKIVMIYGNLISNSTFHIQIEFLSVHTKSLVYTNWWEDEKVIIIDKNSGDTLWCHFMPSDAIYSYMERPTGMHI